MVSVVVCWDTCEESTGKQRRMVSWQKTCSHRALQKRKSMRNCSISWIGSEIASLTITIGVRTAVPPPKMMAILILPVALRPTTTMVKAKTIVTVPMKTAPLSKTKKIKKMMKRTMELHSLVTSTPMRRNDGAKREGRKYIPVTNVEQYLDFLGITLPPVSYEVNEADAANIPC